MKNRTYFIPRGKSASVRCLTFFLCCVCCLVASHTMLGQHFGREWIRYQFPREREASLTKIITDAAGNAYSIGTIESATGANVLTIKYSPSGLKLWEKEYDYLIERTDDVARDIAVDDDGNVYVAGYVYNERPAVPSKTLTIKYDALGNRVWAKLFELEDCASTGTHVVVNNVTGDVIVAGPGYCVDAICYDSEGNFRWQHFIDTSVFIVPGFRYNFQMLLDNTGNVYVTGFVFLPLRDSREYAMAARTYKLTADGHGVWTQYRLMVQQGLFRLMIMSLQIWRLMN